MIPVTNSTKTFKSRFITILLLILIATICAHNSDAAQVTIAWKTLPDPVTGYKVYYGTSSGNYTQAIDAGNVSNYTIPNLVSGTTYYIAATDYDAAGNESGFSNELVATPTDVKKTYSITTTSDSNGDIIPSGNPPVSQASNGSSIIKIITVNQGANQPFTISPNAGYHLASLKADGKSLGALSAYTFRNVVANHTLNATFSINKYSIKASAGTGGRISPAGATTVTSGGSLTYAITPATGYSIVDVKVDGTSVGAVANYTFSNVTANHTIAATFAIKTYTLTASSGTGGAISPAGATTVKSGTSKVFTITPAKGFKIAGVTVDGVSVGAISSYTFRNVTANHTIAATFAIKTYTLTASNGTGGAISPSGTTTVNAGASQTFTITPSPGYQIASIKVDGVAISAISTYYTFNNVNAGHTIAVTFTANTWKNQAITSQSKIFTAKFDLIPNASYIDAVTGFSSGPVTAYTSLAAIIRFNTSGVIDVMNGSNYTAAVSMPYSAGKTYHVRMKIDIPNHKYDAYVTPPGGTEKQLASGYAFRSTQAAVSVLNNIGIGGDVGRNKLVNLSITAQ